VKLALRVRLVRPARKVHRGRKDPSVRKAPSASAGRLVLPDRPDPSDRKGHRGKPAAKAQSALAVNADHQGLKVLLVQPAPPDQQARRAIPGQHRQFASSRGRIASAAVTTKFWLGSFAQAGRRTERSAQHPARRQPVYACAGDLGHGVATSRTFSKSTPPRWAVRSRAARPDRGDRPRERQIWPHSIGFPP